MPATLPPASGVLAVALELQVSSGLDPKEFVEALVDVLELGGSAKALQQGSNQQPNSAGARASTALLLVLEGPASERAKASSDGTVPATAPAKDKLVRGLEAVDALADFCGETKRGKFGAVMSLGVAARCGRGWCAVRAVAEQVPGLDAQLPSLLDTLISGEVVDVRGVAAAPVRTALQVIFECLGLEEQAGTLQDKDEDEDDCGVDYGMDGDATGGNASGEGEVVGRGFGLPSGEGRRAEEAAVVRRTMTLLAAQLRSSHASEYPLVSTIDEPSPSLRTSLTAATKGPTTQQPSSASATSKSALQGPRTARGPAMPSRDELAAAAAAAAAQVQSGGAVLKGEGKEGEEPFAAAAAAAAARGSSGVLSVPGQLGRRSRSGVGAGHGGSDSDDDDDGEGPALPGTKGDWSVGQEGGDGGEEAEAAAAAAKRRRMDSEWALVREKGLSASEAAAQVGADEARMAAGGRESWMLDAPTDKGGSFLDELKKQGAPTKRGFTQMVPHSRAYAGLDDDEEDQKRSAPDAELEAVLAAHRTARGPSLVEVYQQQMAAKGKHLKGGKLSSTSASGLDLGELMGASGSKPVTAHDLNGMVADAKALDSRFSRQVTRQFM